jgi:hypothetical protein
VCHHAHLGFDQYHEPADELPDETRTFARLCASLTEEAEAIGWYEQRLAVESDREARGVMRDAQGEEFKHFCMDLEFLLRRTPLWREIAEGILFQEGSIPMVSRLDPTPTHASWRPPSTAAIRCSTTCARSRAGRSYGRPAWRARWS